MEEGLILSFVKKIMDGVRVSLIEISQMFDIEKALPLELNQQQVMKMLGCSTTTFDRYTQYTDFPKIDRGRGTQLRYPRDAVREWYNANWQRFGM
ncbi:Phage protein [Streptococcus sp. DD10]|uniref:helix-turn-helix transcriptional regulator n=1 Tax=Streptococcus sp. DD10 TaxID=1777878 RepID=UPI000796456E|nr:helix-turn-helix domain-containing protein [Streptococcus sp. DD10]KXT73144.1 Phage protein [Streptococcus sp. DD10]